MPILQYGPRLERFALRPPEYDKKINILIGSVRSGKTWALHAKILALCCYPVAGRRFIIGVSKASVKTNVLQDLAEIVGSANYKYNSQTGELNLCGTVWNVMGAHDDGAEKTLRGATIGCAVVDELVLIPENFFKMLLTRLSPPGSRLYASTNADGPHHFIKTEFLDNTELQDILYSMTVTMRDNPNLEPQYIADQEKLFTGVFYDRMIRGLWKMASGAVYAGCWDDANYYDDRTRPVGLYGQGGYTDHTVSIDYGTTNAFVALDWIDTGKIAYCDNELYWDSVKENRQKTDGELADDLVQFIKDSNCAQQPKIIIDPSAASFKAECLKRGLWVVGCDNDVYAYGIRRVASALSNKLIKFRRSCVLVTPVQLQGYVWDKKKADNGSEQVVKKRDHGPDAVRYFVNDTFANEWRLTA